MASLPFILSLIVSLLPNNIYIGPEVGLSKPSK